MENKEDLKKELYEALIKKAKGYQYEETKTYIKDDDGKKIKTIEKTTRDVPPDLSTINMLLNNIDEDWNKEEKLLKKKQIYKK